MAICANHMAFSASYVRKRAQRTYILRNLAGSEVPWVTDRNVHWSIVVMGYYMKVSY